MDNINKMKEYNKSGTGKYITLGFHVIVLIVQIVFTILMGMFAFNNPDINLRKE